jgi:polyphosphate glucokinase
MSILGIDVGGSGIKGAPVDTDSGRLLNDRLRIETPEGGRPEDVAEVIARIAEHFDWQGTIGCALPAVVKRGVTLTAANIHEDWIGCDAGSMIADAARCPVTLVNDADAAGLAEMRFGAGRDQAGTVIVLTVGTGIGSAIFVDGRLVPNTEFGHLEIRGKEAEHRASDRVRKARDLSWRRWGERFSEVLGRLEALFWPDLFIVGGGMSKKHDRWANYVSAETPVVPAGLLNEAGIVGAAMAARR